MVRFAQQSFAGRSSVVLKTLLGYLQNELGWFEATAQSPRTVSPMLRSAWRSGVQQKQTLNLPATQQTETGKALDLMFAPVASEQPASRLPKPLAQATIQVMPAVLPIETSEPVVVTAPAVPKPLKITAPRKTLVRGLFKEPVLKQGASLPEATPIVIPIPVPAFAPPKLANDDPLAHLMRTTHQVSGSINRLAERYFENPIDSD